MTTVQYSRPVKGDRYLWRSEVHVEVVRVARDGSWADIRCNADPEHMATGWTKRQSLPFGPDFRKKKAS